MRFACEICLRAWVDLFHFTFCEAEDFTIRKDYFILRSNISFTKQRLRQKAGGVGMRSKYIRRIGILCALFLILTATAIGLVYSGAVLLNQPSESEYPVRGVDILAVHQPRTASRICRARKVYRCECFLRYGGRISDISAGSLGEIRMY